MKGDKAFQERHTRSCMYTRRHYTYTKVGTSTKGKNEREKGKSHRDEKETTLLDNKAEVQDFHVTFLKQTAIKTLTDHKKQ